MFALLKDFYREETSRHNNWCVGSEVGDTHPTGDVWGGGWTLFKNVEGPCHTDKVMSVKGDPERVEVPKEVRRVGVVFPKGKKGDG